MSKKTFIITITVFLLVLLGGLIAYYFLIMKSDSGPTNPVTIIKQLFPFGNNNNNATTTEPTRPIVEDPVLTPNFTQKLRKIWALPVAGAGIVDSKAGSTVRHIERATGHIYETELFSPNQSRISNTTIPLIYNAVWPSKNNSVVVEKLEDDDETVSSYIFSIKTGTTTTENVSGSILSYKIEGISIFDDTIFYLQKLNNGSVGFVSVVGSNKSKEIWNSPIREMISQFVNKKIVALTTKPHESVNGYLYFVDTTNGQSKKIIGDIKGLSTFVSSDGLNLIYLSQNSIPTLSLYNIKNQSSVLISPTTFPEKCVWSKKDVNIVYCAVPQDSLDNNSLTRWYMGTATFTDDIWKYDLKNNTSVVISNLINDSNGEMIDVIKPILSENEQYIIFINKKDNSLWSLDLTK